MKNNKKIFTLDPKLIFPLLLVVISLIIMAASSLKQRSFSENTETALANEGELAENAILSHHLDETSLNIIGQAFSGRNSYIALYRQEGEDHDFIAVSGILAAGETQSFVIDVKGSLDYGASVILRMYEDNGDGNFNPGYDYPALDSLGKPVEENFTISPLHQYDHQTNSH